MNIVKINKIPEWAVYYMYYGEDDNLTEEDIVEIEEFMEKEGLLRLVDVGFSSHPAFGLATDCYDCWFEADEGVVGDEVLDHVLEDDEILNEGFKGFKKKALNTVLIFSLGMNAAFVLDNLGRNEKKEIVDTVKEPVQQSLENTTNQVPDNVYVNSEDLCFKYENLTDEEARDLYNRLDSYEDLFGFVKNECGQKTFNKLVRSFALQLGSSKDYAEKAMKNIPVKVEVKKKKI